MALVLSLDQGRSVEIGDVVTVRLLSKVGMDSLLEFVTPTLTFRALLVLQSTVQFGLVTFKVVRGDRGKQIGVAIDAPSEVQISRPDDKPPGSAVSKELPPPDPPGRTAASGCVVMG